MEEPRDPGREYLKELGWAALMANTVMALVGLLVGAQLGDIWLGLGLFLGGGLVLTSVLGLVVAVNYALVWWRARRG